MRVDVVTIFPDFFGVLDVLLAPVVAIGFLVLSRRWDYGRLNLGK